MFCENQHRWFITDDLDHCPLCPMTEGYRHVLVKPTKILGAASNGDKRNGD